MSPAPSAPRGRGHRRVVAPPQNLGPESDAHLPAVRAWQHPDDAPAPAKPADGGDGGRAGEAPAAQDTPVLPNRAQEDTDAAWGELGPDTNDDRLLRDRPPHWQ